MRVIKEQALKTHTHTHSPSSIAQMYFSLISDLPSLILPQYRFHSLIFFYTHTQTLCRPETPHSGGLFVCFHESLLQPVASVACVPHSLIHTELQSYRPNSPHSPLSCHLSALTPLHQTVSSKFMLSSY